MRVRARLQRSRLDTALAIGTDPWSSPELMLRAAQLTRAPERHRIATDLRVLVECANARRPVSMSLQLRDRVVLESQDALLALADRLGGVEPVRAMVVAQLEWVLWDPHSPVFVGGAHPAVLAQLVERCAHATALHGPDALA